MTITLECPVASGTMTEPVDLDAILDIAQVGALIGVTGSTISVYLQRSKAGRVYASNPFPAPDRRIGVSPVWKATRADEIRAWAAARPGTGSGATGRPRKSK